LGDGIGDGKVVDTNDPEHAADSERLERGRHGVAARSLQCGHIAE
jgi:hypothetical protein